MERKSQRSLKSEIRQSCPLPPDLFSIVIEILATAIRHQKEIRGNKSEKKIKLSLSADDILVYMSNPKNSTKELLQLTNIFSNVSEHKIN